LKQEFGAPMHRQLAAVLRSEIMRGRYAAGDLLPGEEALRQLYAVSRTTVRRGLESLEREGLIERRQGFGTIVLGRGVDLVNTSGVSALVKGIAVLDASSVIRTYAYEEILPSEAIREALRLESGEKVLRLLRVRECDGEALWQLAVYLPLWIGQKLVRSEVEHVSIYEVLKRAGSPCHQAEELIGAALADPGIAMLLNIKIGAPLIETTRLIFDAQARPIALQVALIPPERRRLRVHIFADESSTLPVTGAPGIFSPT
jgi:GntR family transcriptional regulator